jgi:protein arginine kinase activator
MSVTCQICKIRPAQVHYTEIVNGNMVVLNLCQECAEEKGIDVQPKSSYGLGDLVAGLIDTTVGLETDKIGKVTCPACGYDYSDFKRIGRLGCPECYVAFEAQLVPMLRHIHGNTHHAGRKPAPTGLEAPAATPSGPSGPPAPLAEFDRERHIESLKEELVRAVEVEDYERAATLRDEIRVMEGGGDPARGRVKDDE